MSTASTSRDPRSVVTPEAFAVAEELLGKPLATPARRLVAILIDLVVVLLITGLTRSFALVLGAFAAVFFVRAGFKRTKVRNSVFGRAMRFSVGCLGLIIGLATAAVFLSLGDDDGDEPSALEGIRDEIGVEAGREGSGGALARLTAGALRLALAPALADASDARSAEDAIVGYIEAARELGLGDDRIRDDVLASIPDDAPWRGEALDVVDRRLPAPEAPSDAVVLASAADAAARLELPAALRRYAELLAVESPGAEEVALRSALRERLASDVAADTLGALADRLAALESDYRAQSLRLRAAEAQFEEASRSTPLDWLRDFADDIGFGFGWWSFYMTILLSWWNGQTVGKKMLGLRVVRLDGEPINWWVGFERGGGYVAGFATGLLGFLQVFWDSNRQAIHDRIVGTVVVVDAAEPVSDWENAL